MLPRATWKRTGKPLKSKNLDFNDYIPAPRTEDLSGRCSVLDRIDPLSVYQRLRKRERIQCKRRSLSPLPTDPSPFHPPEPRTLKILPRFDVRNRKFLGSLLPKSRLKKPEFPIAKSVSPVSQSELYIDQLISQRKKIDFDLVPKGKNEGETGERWVGEGKKRDLSLLDRVGKTGKYRVDTRVRSGFLSPTRQWKWGENETFLESKKGKNGIGSEILSPEAVLKKRVDDFQKKIKRAFESCEAYVTTTC